ncbi:MAG: PEGA domain-containing protein [Pseudomonadota bacterium]
MKNISIIIVFCLLISLGLYAQKDNIVILNFNNKENVIKKSDQNYLEDLSRSIVSNLLPKNKYNVYTSENLLQMLQANDIKLCEAEGDCEVETMRNIQAKYGVTGNIIKFSGQIKIILKIYHSGSGSMIGSEIIEGKKVSELEEKIKDSVKKLIGKIYDYKFNKPIVTMFDKENLGEIVLNINVDESYVFLNNSSYGIAKLNTPFNLSILPGEYDLKLAKYGYLDHIENITIEKNKKLERSISLNPILLETKKLGESRIAISSTPEEGADIYFENKNTGFKTPYTFKKVPTGNYNIYLKKKFYHEHQVPIEIKEGDVKVIKGELNSNHGFIFIQSKPSEASVFLDETSMGVTPFTSSRLVSGKYKLRLQKPLYHTLEKEIIVEDTKHVIEEFDLKPAFGIINIESLPEGATILIDGVEKGITPFEQLTLISGSHQIILRKDLHLEYNRDIDIQDGQTKNFKGILEPNYGVLKIDAEPIKANCYINGEMIGVTPLENYKVSPGTITVKLLPEQSYYKEYSEIIDIGRGDYKIIKPKLEELKGDLIISSTPQGANIYIDGEYKGHTPQRVSNLLAKEYKIELKKEGHIKWETEIEVEDKDTLNVDGELIAINELILIRNKHLIFSSTSAAVAALVATGAYFLYGHGVDLKTHADSVFNTYENSTGSQESLDTLYNRAGDLNIESVVYKSLGIATYAIAAGSLGYAIYELITMPWVLSPKVSDQASTLKIIPFYNPVSSFIGVSFKYQKLEFYE